MWLQDEYFYRRAINLWSPTSVSAGHPVSVLIPKVILDNRKVRSDFEDIEVAYVTEDATPQHVVLAREVEEDDDGIWVTFNLHEDLDANTTLADAYYVYHGNLDLVNQPVRPSDSFAEWPITIDAEGGDIAYTRPGEHWVDGESNTLNARATFLFYGTQVRVLSDRSLTGAIMEAQIDNGEWESVDLFSRIEEPDEEVFAEYGLDPNIKHEIRLRVSGEANPSSLGSEVNVQSIEYKKSVVATDQGEQLGSLVWSSLVGGV